MEITKKVFAALILVLSLCTACKTSMDKAIDMMNHEYRIYDPRRQYFFEYRNDHTDPISFAKDIINGHYDGIIKQWWPHSGVVPILEAFEERYIYRGMSYDEIVSVVGKGRASYYNGRVDVVTYQDHQARQEVYVHFQDGYLSSWSSHR